VRSRLQFFVGSLVLLLSASVPSRAQTFTTLTSFPGYDQFGAFSPLIQGRDGNLYGTALDFSGGYGSVYQLTPTGTVTTLYNFCSQPGCADGALPLSPLVLGTDGNFYGVTSQGGLACNCGIAYRLTLAGVLTVLHSFNGTDGSNPSWLMQSSGGNFFGTTAGGGDSGNGTIFKMTTAGAVTTLHSFTGSDGSVPTGLIQATNGLLYGTTTFGGAYNPACPAFYCGTLFQITTAGAFTSLYSFDYNNGAHPYAPPVQANNQRLYGTTYYFSHGTGSVYGANTNGATLKAVSWWLGTDANPTTSLIQATDGYLYGTVDYSGTGTIYKVGLTGKYSAVYQSGYDFENNTLLQATDGKFYGSYVNDFTSYLYSLDVGLGPFVAFVQPSGKVGSTVQILGQGLTGTTKVIFDGLPASSFSVVSDTYLTAVVPSHAGTGVVVVTTPTGTLTSNVSFRITQ
jgi:uncharacterized repeat protein (TIGR03803 family)